MHLGEQIKKIRNKKGLTMKQLAERCGLAGKGTIDSYESGRRTPHLHTLEKIATALNCDVEILLKEKES